MSVTANHCHDQRVHPTSAQQSRAGPHFRQISHSASAAATPDDDLEPGHQKPHLLQSPYTTSAQSKAVQECSLQPLPVLDLTPGGLPIISGPRPPLCTAPAPARRVLCQGISSGVAAGQPLLVFFGQQSFGATFPRRKPLISLLAFFLATDGASSAFQLKRWRKST